MPRKVTHNGLVALKIAAGDPLETYRGLLWVAQDKGYRQGWVSHKFREIFGHWPDYDAAAQPPDLLLIEYLGIMKARYKAKKQRQEKAPGDYAKIKTANGIEYWPVRSFDKRLLEIEVILADLEVLEADTGGIYRQDTDGEALAIVTRMVQS